jgi:hypothetical protein
MAQRLISSFALAAYQLKSMRVTRAGTAGLSVIFAAGVALLVSIYTARWGWRIGSALAVLVLAQGLFETWRASTENSMREGHSLNDQTSPIIYVEQEAKSIERGKVVGVSGASLRPKVVVSQKIEELRDAQVIGVDQSGVNDDGGRQ